MITDLAILRPHGAERELHLSSLHPGVGLDRVRERTGWELQCAPDVVQTPPPTAEELEALGRVDPEGYWCDLQAVAQRTIALPKRLA